jgi:hypothetical protein
VPSKETLEADLRDAIRLAYAIGSEIEAIRFRIQTEEIISKDLLAQLWNNKKQIQAELAQDVINMLEVKQFIYERKHIKELVVRNQTHLKASSMALDKNIAEKRATEMKMESILKQIGQFGKVVNL